MPEPAARRILVTRPEGAAERTAFLLHARGHIPIRAPLMRIVPRVPPLPADVQAILATSANALHAGIASRLPACPLLAVGDATAASARAAGLAGIHSAGRDAEALAALAIARLDPRGAPLLLLSGAGQGHTLAATLRAAGFRVARRVAYAARPEPALPEAARTALRQGLDCALFFSPESARLFVRLAQRAGLAESVARVEALAISSATRAALAGLPWRRIRVASAPNQDALLALLP